MKKKALQGTNFDDDVTNELFSCKQTKEGIPNCYSASYVKTFETFLVRFVQTKNYFFFIYSRLKF